MNHRERLLAVLRGDVPDCVPVSPDFSNMIPARRTGKPFWDIYLYNDPPLWEAYVDTAKYFDIDALMAGHFPLCFPDEMTEEHEWEKYIVFKNDQRIVVQRSHIENGKRLWEPFVTVYYVADPPTARVPPGRIGLPEVPRRWEPLTGVKAVDYGPEGFRSIKESLGNQGIIGVYVTYSCALFSEEDIYRYHDTPEIHEQWAEQRVRAAEDRFARIMQMDVKPDFLCVGASGTLIFQTVEIFRKLAFPAVRRVIELATAAGLPTHVHSCGPEKELVKIFAEETDLTVIDPLEPPPMGDCDLAELKQKYGNGMVLSGNLHTTEVMLRGTRDDVAAASRKAIDDAAAGGGFILSTGDQCGRDTPDENIFTMVETARTYGSYR